jgi:cytochrome c oxidase subunit II
MNPALQSALDPAGPAAARILDLFWLFAGVCGVVYLLVIAALVWAVLRRRARGGAAEPYPEAGVERRLGRVVGGAVGVTVVILAVFVVASFATDRSLARLAEPEDLQIQVIGHQWWWEVRYEYGLPSRSFTTANEIHIPVGRTVRVRLSSPDVIHSFWVPNLHGKTDLIPGLDNETMLRADRPGVYRGQCAEYCGLQHAHMGLLVIADEPDAFGAWYERQLKPAAEPAGDIERRGRDLFLASSCVMCHRIRGTLAGATVGPDLTHLASRQTLAAGTLPNTRGHLGAWIADPQHIKPGTNMPIPGIDGSALNPLVSYLSSLE